MVVIVSHISGSKQTWSLPGCNCMLHILDELCMREGGLQNIIIREGRRLLDVDSVVSKDAILTATLPLVGGKGGFGSMLRAIGAQIEKTTNREACRDLSGRRLRDINEEKRLKDFIAKKAEKEKEALERKKKKFEELKSTPKHLFQDESYYEQKETRERVLHDAIDKVFSEDDPTSQESTSKKRSSESSNPQPKKKNRFFDDLEDSSEEECDETNIHCAKDDIAAVAL